MPKDKKDLPNVLSQEDDATTKEEALAKVAVILAETRDPALMTELYNNEIKIISRAEAIHSGLKNPMLHEFLREFKRHRVSLARKGRKELGEMAKGINEREVRNPFQRMFMR
jgi:hypothetical protein